MEETGLVVPPSVTVKVGPLIWHCWESISGLVSYLDEFTGVVEVSNGVVEPNVIVTPTITIGVDPLKGVVGECVVHISPSVEVSIGTAVSVVLVGLPKDIGTIITAWDVRVVPESIAISVSPLEWVFPERIDRVNKTIAVIIGTASGQCIG